jgi:hypothetical protein
MPVYIESCDPPPTVQVGSVTSFWPQDRGGKSLVFDRNGQCSLPGEEGSYAALAATAVLKAKLCRTVTPCTIRQAR